LILFHGKRTLSSMVDHFTSLVKQYGPAVYRQAYGMLGSRQEAEEAAQDVFMIIHDKLDTFRGESRLSTWIYTITFRACLRRRSAQKHVFVSFDDDSPLGAPELQHGDPAPDAVLIERERTTALARQISLLAPHEAAALTLYYFEDTSYEEIGEILEMPPGTVATTLHRARHHLHAIIAHSRKEEKAQ
jgi:RNA polymerase sigma factor (sigma-70 family)